MDDPALAGWSTVFVFGVVFCVGCFEWGCEREREMEVEILKWEASDELEE